MEVEKQAKKYEFWTDKILRSIISFGLSNSGENIATETLQAIKENNLKHLHNVDAGSLPWQAHKKMHDTIHSGDFWFANGGYDELLSGLNKGSPSIADIYSDILCHKLTLDDFADSEVLYRYCVGMTAHIAYSFLTSFFRVNLITAGHSNLILLDSKLAIDLYRSNQPKENHIDLGRIPFEWTLIEFNRPIKLRDGMTATALGYYLNKEKDLGCVVWYFLEDADNPPYEAVDKIVNKIPRSDNIYYSGYACLFVRDFKLNTWSVSDNINKLFNNDYSLCFSMLDGAKSIVEFLTCRNIEYINNDRDPKVINKIKKYRSLDTKKFGRSYKTIKINRRVSSSKSREPSPIDFEYSVEVPGKWHRHVFCPTCNRQHRHDLLGQPCRKCGLTVDNTNAVRETFWHNSYVWGDGPRKNRIIEMKQ